MRSPITSIGPNIDYRSQVRRHSVHYSIFTIRPGVVILGMEEGDSELGKSPKSPNDEGITVAS